MKKIFKLSTFVIILFILLFSCRTLVLAQDGVNLGQREVTYEKVNPDGGFSYLSKRIGEKVKLFFTIISPQTKENYYKELSNRRLAELVYVIDKDKKGEFEKATLRYSSTIGSWSEYIITKQLNDKKGPARDFLTMHLPVVENLMNKYDGTTAEWRFVKQDADYIKIYISKLQN